MRLKRLTDSIPEGIDGVLLVGENNIRYFTGFCCDAGMLLASRGGCAFFTDSRYTEAAVNTIDCCPVEDSARLPELLPKYCEQFGITKLAGEASIVTVARAERLSAMLGDSVSLIFGDYADRTVNALRSVKDDGEASLVRCAQAIAEAAFEHILGFIAPGITERDIQLELDYYMLRNGAESVSFDTIAVSGCKTSMPHGVPSDKVVCRGELVTLDFGAVFRGYHSDMTRTFAIGDCSQRQREIYSIVLSAQKAALSVLAPGISCRDADAAARDLISSAGYAKDFGHGTGHGVGLEIHESPTLNPRSSDILEPGNIVTVEPGIYLAGEFGVRIEDMALITDSGYINLTSSPKELLVI